MEKKLTRCDCKDAHTLNDGCYYGIVKTYEELLAFGVKNLENFKKDEDNSGPTGIEYRLTDNIDEMIEINKYVYSTYSSNFPVNDEPFSIRFETTGEFGKKIIEKVIEEGDLMYEIDTKIGCYNNIDDDLVEKSVKILFETYNKRHHLSTDQEGDHIMSESLLNNHRGWRYMKPKDFLNKAPKDLNIINLEDPDIKDIIDKNEKQYINIRTIYFFLPYQGQREFIHEEHGGKRCICEFENYLDLETFNKLDMVSISISDKDNMRNDLYIRLVEIFKSI